MNRWPVIHHLTDPFMKPALQTETKMERMMEILAQIYFLEFHTMTVIQGQKTKFLLNFTKMEGKVAAIEETDQQSKLSTKNHGKNLHLFLKLTK
jgi:hypothetical protein